MGVKINYDTISKYPNGQTTPEFWAQCAEDILRCLYQRGLPIDINTIEVFSEAGVGYAIGYFQGEESIEELEEGSQICLQFSQHDNDNWSLDLYFINGFNEASSGNYYFYPLSRWDTYSPSSQSYYFYIRSYSAGSSFIFELNGFEPVIVTPLRSLSKPNNRYGYAMVSAISPGFFGFHNDDSPSFSYFKSYPLLKDYNYNESHISQFFPFSVDSIPTKMLPERSTGKIITIPVFTGIEDIYYQDVYLTNLAHTEGMAKAYETDQGVLLVVETDLPEFIAYTGADLYTSWEQYPVAQMALDISSTYNI